MAFNINAALNLTGIYGVDRAVSSLSHSLGQALQFDRNMVRLTQSASESREEILRLSGTIGHLGATFGTSSGDLVKAAVTYKQAGLSLVQTRNALEAVSKASLSPSFGSLAETTEGSLAVMTQFKVKAEGLTQALGSLNSVSSDYAVESGDLIQGVKRAGGAFSQTGGSLSEFLGLMTAVRSTTREAAPVIANGLRTVFTRLQREDTVRALKELNVNLRYTREEAEALGDSSLVNQAVKPFEALKRASQGLSSLSTSDPRFSRAVQALGGVHHTSQVLPLLNNFDLAEQARRSAEGGSVSLDIAASRGQDALLTKGAKTGELFNTLVKCDGRSEDVARAGRKTWRPDVPGYSSAGPASRAGVGGSSAPLRRLLRASLSR